MFKKNEPYICIIKLKIRTFTSTVHPYVNPITWENDETAYDLSSISNLFTCTMFLIWYFNMNWFCWIRRHDLFFLKKCDIYVIKNKTSLFFNNNILIKNP